MNGYYSRFKVNMNIFQIKTVRILGFQAFHLLFIVTPIIELK